MAGNFNIKTHEDMEDRLEAANVLKYKAKKHVGDCKILVIAGSIHYVSENESQFFLGSNSVHSQLLDVLLFALHFISCSIMVHSSFVCFFR